MSNFPIFSTIDPRKASPHRSYLACVSRQPDGLYSLTIADENGGFADMEHASLGAVLALAMEWVTHARGGIHWEEGSWL